ncbi:MAG: DUF4266 domain-containing protein [Gammaproteobacteria bacterium]|nr:DUF4266 domain-containing protein [Gammaproteobacteria bacterium]
MPDTRFRAALLALIAAMLLSGCAPLHPWERGNLAKPHMALTTNSGQAAMKTHLEMSREAASGGGAAAGGGCGCN